MWMWNLILPLVTSLCPRAHDLIKMWSLICFSNSDVTSLFVKTSNFLERIKDLFRTGLNIHCFIILAIQKKNFTFFVWYIQFICTDVKSTLGTRKRNLEKWFMSCKSLAVWNYLDLRCAMALPNKQILNPLRISCNLFIRVSYQLSTSDLYRHRLHGHKITPDFRFILLIHHTGYVAFICFLNIYKYKIWQQLFMRWGHTEEKCQ